MTTIKASSTVNPLHFEDLEPHRFEDLIRQLIYDVRNWKSLEAIGRTGRDEGIDIRAIEAILPSGLDIEDESNDEKEISTKEDGLQERMWLIQCKREHRIGPTRIRRIVSSNLSREGEKPHVYMLVAACDFSKASRDAFRDEVFKYGVEEFYIWGKAEIEDQLFQPKNDHLLFAYFNISLQVRRRSIKTTIRTQLSLKRRLVKELGDINQTGLHVKAILIRDPYDKRYPRIDSPSEFIKSTPWRYWALWGHMPPDHLSFVFRKYFAYVNWETKEYDILSDLDCGVPLHPTLSELDDNWWDMENLYTKCHTYWLDSIAAQNQAWAIELRKIHYNRILAFDEIGDICNEGPHLLVDYGTNGDPFDPKSRLLLLESTDRFIPAIRQEDAKRIEFFPSVVSIIGGNSD